MSRYFTTTTPTTYHCYYYHYYYYYHYCYHYYYYYCCSVLVHVLVLPSWTFWNLLEPLVLRDMIFFTIYMHVI